MIESDSTNNNNHLLNTHFRPSILPGPVHTLSQISFTTDHNLTARVDRARVLNRPLFQLEFLVAVLSYLTSFFWSLGWDKAANLRKCLGSGFQTMKCITICGFGETRRPLAPTPHILGFVRAGVPRSLCSSASFPGNFGVVCGRWPHVEHHWPTESGVLKYKLGVMSYIRHGKGR